MDVEQAGGALADLSGWASPSELLRSARVMVVDDVATEVHLLERMLKGAGVGEVLGVRDPRKVEGLCRTWNPDLILLDLHMPRMDGVAVLNMLRATTPEDTFLPVIVLTGDVTDAAKEDALTAGAKDFVSKPFELAEVLLRVRNLLSTRALYLRLQRHQSLELMMALTRDRQRIALDLHDTVLQQLFGESLRLQSIVGLVDEPIGERISSTIDVLDQSVRQLRMVVFSLQGPVGVPHGVRARLVKTLTAAADELGFEPRLQFDGPLETLQMDTADDLMSALREALSNIAKHAQAQTARVDVAVAGDIALTVTDDGVGVPSPVAIGGGLGRAADGALRLGGSCAVARGASGGTVFSWQVPA